jgi:hypothetical protein
MIGSNLAVESVIHPVLPGLQGSAKLPESPAYRRGRASSWVSIASNERQEQYPIPNLAELICGAAFAASEIEE